MNIRLAILFLIPGLYSIDGGSQTMPYDLAFVSIKPDRSFTESPPASSYMVEEWMQSKKPAQGVLGNTSEGRAVKAFFFPGASDRKALVIGGMHGSELSSIDIAEKLIGLLSTGTMPYYNVIVIPVLFPDNAEKAKLPSNSAKSNLGRYTNGESVDPNRQMPPLGKPFQADCPLDLYGRIIEKENQYLLQLIQDFSPARILNLHAIKDVTKAGIYADPRTDCYGYALGFESDSCLAVTIASFIETGGGSVPGNFLQQAPTALYHKDPDIAARGSLQKRNLEGSSIANRRGHGVSLGGWASTAVCAEVAGRNGARVITVEFPGYGSAGMNEASKQADYVLNVRLYASALRSIFLEENYLE